MKQRAVNLGAVLLAAALVLGIAGSSNAGSNHRRDLATAVAPLRLVPHRNTTIAVGGLHRYFGTIAVDAQSDGLTIVDRLALERYLLGLNEVPVTWPEEALKAQAVAARTFALYTLASPPRPDAAAHHFDICATDQCQVFSGADVVSLPDGERWRAAVDATAGQGVLYRGVPIFARYHSTSGGRTLSNGEGFPGEPDYPYLQPVSSTTERASPLYRWRVTFPLPDLQSILVRAGWWSASLGKLRVARTVSAASVVDPDIVFHGSRGRIVETAERLREAVRTLAPAMFPGRYPSPADTSSGVLPETFPSNRLTIWTRRGVVHVLGRGWGHGVGMSQWGARGLALRGASYDDILAHYYAGTTVGSASEPRRADVGLAWGSSSTTASGDFTIVDGAGHTLVRRALGTWRFTWNGEGAVAVDPPLGFGLPLRVGIVDAPRRVAVGASAFLTIALSRPARVQPRTSAPAPAEPYPRTVKSAGRRRIPWRAPPEPGRYRVVVRASTGAKTRRSRPVEIVVQSAGRGVAAERAAAPDGGFDAAWLPWLALLFLVVTTVAATGLAARIGR